MPKKRSRRGVRCLRSTPFLRNKQPELTYQRELSFASWEGLDDAAISNLTEALDKELALLDQDVADELPAEVNTLPDAVYTEASGGWPHEVEDIASTPLTRHSRSSSRHLLGQQQASGEINEGQARAQVHVTEAVVTAEPYGEEAVVTAEPYDEEAVVTVEPYTEKAVITVEPGIGAPTPIEVNRGPSEEVAIGNDHEHTLGLEGEQVAPLQGGQGSRENPIVLDFEDNEVNEDNEDNGLHVQSQYPGVVFWSDPEYEKKIITDFDDKWCDIQAHWLDMGDLRDRVQDTRLSIMLTTFSDSFDDVYDEGRLAEGTAAFLSDKWKPIKDRAVRYFTERTQREQLEKLSTLLEDFKDQEPLYDIIIAHPSQTE